MTVLIGTDEAGYGPNLGPLVISATVWRIPGSSLDVDLYETLSRAVLATAPSDPGDTRLAIADSKVLYKPGGGLEWLEVPVLAGLRLLGVQAADWRGLCVGLDPTCGPDLDLVPWYRTFRVPLPHSVTQDRIDEAEQRLGRTLAESRVQLLAIRSRAVFPNRFNQLIDQYGNKAETLSRLTLDLAAELSQSVADEPILISCDKHGGRNRYGALLQQRFPDDLVEVRLESRPQSIYRWGPASRRLEARFIVGGEGFLPSALASMACKYFRELAMHAFNHFWCQRVAGLKPTAGYPVDARRFKYDIRLAQRRLGITDNVLWRSR